MQILLTLSSKNVRGPAARSTEYGVRSAESMRYMRYRIAVSVWRLDNSDTTLAACNYPGPRPPFSLPFHLRTFAQAEGRFPPLHGYLSALRTLYSVLRTPQSALLFHLYTGAPLRFALLHCNPFLHASPRSFAARAHRLANRLPQLRHRCATRINRHRTGFGHRAAMRVIGKDLLLNLNQ